jgi:uncharacterized membrane protein YccF (DUF307 family)/endonuclease YncB( thermonuclease family)
MRALGNILWHFPFLGFVNAIVYYLFGLLLTVTVIGAPLGLGLMELGKFYLSPFGREMVRASDMDSGTENGLWKTYSIIVMLLWLPLGLLMAAATIVQVFFLFISIFGIPAAIAIAKSLGTIFNPVGKRCVSVEAAQKLREHAADIELGRTSAASLPRAHTISTTVGKGVDNKAKTIASVVGLVLVGFVAIGTIFSSNEPAKPPSDPPIATNPRPTSPPAVSTPAIAPAKSVPVVSSPAVQSVVEKRGPAHAVDTVTVNVQGAPLRLAGLESTSNAKALQVQQSFLAQAGDLNCTPAGSAWRCITVKGLDVAEIYALSGLTRVSSSAPQALRDAEAQARQNGKGIWGAP